MRNSLWVLMNPDNNHWNEEFARQELTRLAGKWGVQFLETGETRDSGAGQERKFVLEGDEEDVYNLVAELDEALY